MHDYSQQDMPPLPGTVPEVLSI